jgi:hypothetical protein
VPPLAPVPGVIKTVVTCSGNDGRIAQNVLHYSYTGPAPNNSDLNDFCLAVWNAWVAQLTPFQPAGTSLVRVDAVDLSSILSASGFEDNGGAPVPGTSVGGLIPISTAFLVSKQVGRRFRGGHPRSYFPIGVVTDLNNDGDWKGASVTAMLNGAVAFIVAPLGNTYGATTIQREVYPTYFSKNINPVPPYTVIPPLVTQINLGGYSGGQKLATQRRRVRR